MAIEPPTSHPVAPRTRVVLIADSIGQMSLGFSEAFTRLQALVSPETFIPWLAPNGQVGWPVNEGTAVPCGIDRQGTLLTPTQRAGTTDHPLAANTIAVWFEAHPAGSGLEIRIDGDHVDTIDTSCDEERRPTDADRPSQRWVSPPLPAGHHDFLLTAVGEGTARIEATQLRATSGIEVLGAGKAGRSTGQVVADGNAIALVRSMVNRGEPPDLIVLACDTATREPLTTVLADVATLADALRLVASGTELAYFVPHRHDGAHYATWATEFVPAMRAMCAAEGFITIDGYAALGDCSTRADPNGWSLDGVHLSPQGDTVCADALFDVLRPHIMRLRSGSPS